MKLEGRVAIVTGGGSGIGRGICRQIAKEGGKVVVCDIDAESAAATVASITEDGGEATSLKTDVTKKSEVRKMVEESRTKYGRIAKPSDVAKAAVFLASDDAEFITGSTLNVSGGREMH